jgi:hypothetical protein
MSPRTATAPVSPVFGSDKNQSPTVTGEWNISTASWFFSWHQPAGTAMPQDAVLEPEWRGVPATMNSLLAWGRRLLRTGAKKIDLDLE